ncbi:MULTISPECIES: hypothetical protein [Mycobacteroides]|uniref:hypothetical protein n=1 Tax=Mycobacteroides TaxID=670516 RepID=UPI0008A9D8A6|nr:MULTISPECIES: hypothetical protein [Mycobacteroides]AYM40362.1 hypothetical protein DYE20_01290 [[Mycobacterium] chelonae subsp. gwanakae]OHU15946.1 hypothetical protein BKG75_12950 [Mycobacteroides chelonae]SHR98662.1 Uncharacterised protein [Mycobacteroides abscessus subsp. abscessus]
MSLFNEKWIPFSLADLGDDESLPIDDASEYVPYLLERWPEGGKPNRVEFTQPGPRPNPRGVDGWVVFRLPPKERPVDPTAPTINWDAVRKERLRGRED